MSGSDAMVRPMLLSPKIPYGNIRPERIDRVGGGKTGWGPSLPCRSRSSVSRSASAAAAIFRSIDAISCASWLAAVGGVSVRAHRS